MGGNKSESTGGLPKTFIDALTQYSQQTQPLRDVVIGQTEEAYRTGGVGAQIPTIDSAVSQTNRALSQTLRGQQDQLSAGNLTGTPFGQNTLAQTELQGRQASSLLPTQIAQGLMQGGPDILQGILGSLQSGQRSRSSARGGGILTS